MSNAKKPRLRRWGLLLGGICLSVVLLVSLAAPALAAEPGSGSGSLPAGITPVVILSGSDYDMGYQYSQQVIAFYGPWFYQITPRVYEPFTDAQIKALKAYQWYLKQYAPEFIDQIRGMADGATASGVPMTYAEALARQTGTRAFPGTEPPGSESDTLPPTSTCSVWAAWGKTTKDGSLIGGDSVDGNVRMKVVTVALPAVGNSYIACPIGGFMNNKGVYIGGSGGFCRRPQDSAASYDIPRAGTSQHMLRFCNTAKEVLDLSLAWKASGGGNRMIADVGGDAYVLESSAAFKVARKAGDFGEGDFLTMRNNFFTNEGRDATYGVKFWPHGGWQSELAPGVEDRGGFGDITLASARTNQTMFNMLSQYRGKVDLNFAKMFWRFAGKMPKDPISTAEFRATNAAAWETPLNLENDVVSIALPDNGDEGRMYVCTGPAARVASAYEPGEDDDYYQIGNTFTFYELTLAATPADVVEQAKLAAKFDQAKAYQELMWVPFGAVHAELMPLFDKAVSEYEEGENWEAWAAKASGNDEILYYAQATTAYGRSQCHAQQVYEALVKPPTTPSALGLRPYVAFQHRPVSP